MNPRLVICLLASVLVGALAGFLGLSAGLGWIAALLLYCVAGSLSLVGTAVAIEQAEVAAALASRIPALARTPIRRR